MMALGGFSGTGKTVLARDLAPALGTCPGAVHLRTDTERKAGATPADYTPAARAAIYDRLLARAATLLAAGRSVILDGTFLDPDQRRAAKACALRSGAAFHGLWLTAPEPVLAGRVTARRGDASDADAAVVRAQVARAAAAGLPQDWPIVDAGGRPDETRAAARAALGSVLGTAGDVTVKP
jgi:predicted kinase